MFSFFIGQFFPSHSIVIISIILSFPKIAAALFVNSFGSVEKKIFTHMSRECWLFIERMQNTRITVEKYPRGYFTFQWA